MICAVTPYGCVKITTHGERETHTHKHTQTLTQTPFTAGVESEMALWGVEVLMLFFHCPDMITPMHAMPRPHAHALCLTHTHTHTHTHSKRE